MIPNRLLLRALTVLALTRGGDGPVFPTMANEAVFDTKLRPVTDTATEVMTPIIHVYTDSDSRVNMEKGGGTRPNWKRTVTIMLELAIGSLTSGKMKYVETDPELEAMLDLFELEAELALFAIDDPFALAWRSMIKSFDDWESIPFRSAEQASRFAVRQIG